MPQKDLTLAGSASTESSSDGGRSTNDGGLSTNDGGRSTNDGGRSTDDGGLSTNDGGRSTDDGGLSTDTGPTLADTDAATDSEAATTDGGEAATTAPTESPSDDVGFSPLEPQSETATTVPKELSPWYREMVAKCLIDLGRVHEELDGLHYASPSMKVALRRSASIETAERICTITEKEIEKRGEQ